VWPPPFFHVCVHTWKTNLGLLCQLTLQSCITVRLSTTCDPNIRSYVHIQAYRRTLSVPMYTYRRTGIQYPFLCTHTVVQAYNIRSYVHIQSYRCKISVPLYTYRRTMVHVGCKLIVPQTAHTNRIVTTFKHFLYVT